MAARKRAAGPGLGLADSYMDAERDARTGRPIRKRIKTSLGSDFVDSAIAFSDSNDDSEDSDAVLSSDSSDEDNKNKSNSHGPRKTKKASIKVLKLRRRRRRSPSPPLSDDQDLLQEDLLLDSGNASDVSSVIAPPEASQIILKDLVINLPPGHRGIITLQLTPPITYGSTPVASAPAVSLVGSRGKKIPLALPSLASSKKSNIKKGPKLHPNAGFLDLPAELRIQIYRQVLVSTEDFRFDNPYNFGRCAAMLRTCKQVHDEACTVLYGENKYVFVRRNARCGSYWAKEWHDIGYKVVRRFLKSIGPTNTGLLRSVSLILNDATPSLCPSSSTVDMRRFVNDEILISILRHLADYSLLQRLELHFQGRRQVFRADQRFLDYLLEIQADEVIFTPSCSYASKQDGWVTRTCLDVMQRRTKLYEKKPDKPTKEAKRK